MRCGRAVAGNRPGISPAPTGHRAGTDLILLYHLKLFWLQISCKLNELRIIIEYVKILVAYGGNGFGAVLELGKSGNSNFVKQFTSEPAKLCS
jgi:hypothetical protein